MAFGSFNPQRQPSMMSDINVTPMVDVMLVLLIIFIITAPMLTQSVKLDLPQAQAEASVQPLEAVSIAIDAQGVIYWNDDAVGEAGLGELMMEAALMDPQPELQLRADRNTRYEVVAQVMAAAQSKGLTKLGFVTDPVKEKK
ncbi:ExbD/TolR family protein [Massilia soli]|uniref:Biopolymer transporter ExbD n=1 Tax=Massilia soli TaxID=2792854 RepID=A0ABS7SP86_9BURK|nr:biopolymer transporter ExbD [Massilia soli]MBZ2207999.1 biopolymer transporter ExbD [Massilia soli]